MVEQGQKEPGIRQDLVGIYRYLMDCHWVENEAPLQEPTVTAPDIQQTQIVVEASEPEIELETHFQL